MGEPLDIAIDLDDVTIDFFEGNIQSIYCEFGVQLRKQDCKKWDKNPVKDFPWKDYGYDSWWDWMRQRDWLWATFAAVPGAIAGIHALRARGHFLEALTLKPRWAEAMVWRWLGRWRPAFQQVTIVPTGESKLDYSDADVLIDDKAETIRDWSADGRWAVLFTQPWNEDLDVEQLGDHVIRANDWDGVLAAIELIQEGIA